MERSGLCRFFGAREAGCDMGCDYISPHDVEVIIQHCTSRYEDCSVHQQLMDRIRGAGDEACEPPCAEVA